MIQVSSAVQGTNFHFNAEGVEMFIRGFKNLSAGQSFATEGILFVDKNGTETLHRLVLSLGADTAIRIGKREIRLVLEPEDVEYSLERFEKASGTKTFGSPEWLPGTNLLNGKSWYLYVFWDHKP